MSFPPPDDINLFEAPRAEIGATSVAFGVDEEAEAIRRAHLSHEASVKSIGSLNILGSLIFGAFAFFSLLVAAGVVGPGGPDVGMARVVLGIVGAIYLFLFGLFGSIGYGLRKLQAWARWTMLVLNVLILLLCLLILCQLAIFAAIDPRAMPALPILILTLSLPIMGYFLYFFVAPRANVVFSPAYKEIIARTPHIKYRMSPIMRIFLVLLLGLITVGGVVLMGGGH